MADLVFAPSPSAEPTATAPAQRVIRHEIELLRLLSALGIVWLHAGVLGSHVGQSGLMIFAVLSIYLSGTGKSITQRAQRLLLPWLIWSAIYVLPAIAAHRPALDNTRGPLAGVLEGTAYHLWYLPFIFIALVLLDGYKRVVSPAAQAWTGAVGTLVLLLTLRRWLPLSESWGLPWLHYMEVLPALFFGLFLSRENKIPHAAHRTLLALIWLAALSLPQAGIGMPYKVGFSIAILALLWPPRAAALVDVRAWSRCTLGIYLLHPLLLMPLIPLRDHLGIAMPLIAFVGSAIIVRLALRVDWLARYAL